jgi:hypothetical protein
MTRLFQTNHFVIACETSHNKNPTTSKMPRVPKVNHAAAATVRASVDNATIASLRASVDASRTRRREAERSRRAAVATIASCLHVITTETERIRDAAKAVKEDMAAIRKARVDAFNDLREKQRAAVPAAITTSVDAILDASPLPRFEQPWAFAGVNLHHDEIKLTLRQKGEQHVVTVPRMTYEYTSETQVLNDFAEAIVALKRHNAFDSVFSVSTLVEWIAGDLAAYACIPYSSFSSREDVTRIVHSIVDKATQALDNDKVCLVGHSDHDDGDDAASVDDSDSDNESDCDPDEDCLRDRQLPAVDGKGVDWSDIVWTDRESILYQATAMNEAAHVFPFPPVSSAV